VSGGTGLRDVTSRWLVPHGRPRWSFRGIPAWITGNDPSYTQGHPDVDVVGATWPFSVITPMLSAVTCGEYSVEIRPVHHHVANLSRFWIHIVITEPVYLLPAHVHTLVDRWNCSHRGR
jgi:hypothetical protein